MREAIRMYWGLCEQQRECTLNLVASFTSMYSQSEAIRGTRCTLGLIASFTSRYSQSEAIRGNQRQSEAIRGNWRQLEAI